MEKKKSWFMRLRIRDRFANGIRCFTLGGSLIPPNWKLEALTPENMGTSCGKPCQH